MIVSLKQRKMNLHIKPRIKLNNNIYIVFINELNNYMKIFMESIFDKSRKKWLGIKLINIFN